MSQVLSSSLEILPINANADNANEVEPKLLDATRYGRRRLVDLRLSILFCVLETRQDDCERLLLSSVVI